MIEILGLGIPRERDGWRLRSVCARMDRATLTAVVSRDPAERRALLDAVTGHLFPEEGRVYISRIPVTPGTCGRLRSIVAEVGADADREEGGSLIGSLLRLLRRASGGARPPAARALQLVGLEACARRPLHELDRRGRARLAVARALARGAEYLVVREPDGWLGADSAELLAMLGRLARTERLCVLASVASPPVALTHADRVLVLGDGGVVFAGAPQAMPARAIAVHAGLVAGVA